MQPSQLQLTLQSPVVAAPRSDRLCIGTCGFSYKEWVGPFYPPGTKMADMLPFYAREFNCVEINSTFYGIPPAERTLKFAAATPDDFTFIIKANQDMTHTSAPVRATFDEFKRCLSPLERTGKLSCILAQFPQRFHRDDDNIAYLRKFRQWMKSYCVVVEFRHASWDEPQTIDLLDELSFHFCCVDAPRLRGLMPAVQVVTGNDCPFGPLAYARFHGRNARQWHQHEEAWMRYNYLYSDEQLQPWADWVTSMRAEGATADARIFTLFNNHAQAKAVEDARRMRRLIAAV